MRSPAARIALAFLVTRLILVGATLVPWPVAKCREYGVDGPDGARTVTKIPWKTDPSGVEYYGLPVTWLDAFIRMDAEYYLFIAAVGYGPETHPHPQTPGFFPGYPVVVGGLARGINAATGHGGAPLAETRFVAALSAFLVSNLALLLAALASFRLAKAFLDEKTAEAAAILLLVSPLSFFGSAFLAESLFLLLSIASFGAAARGRAALAALLGGAAAFTRPIGALLVIPLFLMLSREKPEGRAGPGRLLWLLLVPAGAAGVLFWQWQARGDPWAYLAIQRAYGHGDFPDFAGVADLFRVEGKDTLGLVRDAVQVACLAAAVVCLVPLVRAACKRTLPAAFWVWAFVSIAVALLSGHLISLPRYVFAAFPLFVGAAMLLPAARRAGVWVACTALQLAGFVVFMRAWPVLI